MGYFEKAFEYLIRPADGEPGNERYLKSLGMADKGPELYKEICRHGFGQQPTARGHSASANARSSSKWMLSDQMYDALGWVIVVAGIALWIGMGRHHNSSPPPR